MMRLDTDRPDATMLWKGSSRSELPDETDGLHALITTPIILDDYVYGVGSYGELRGLSARTGERLWMSSDMTVQNRWGTAFMVQHRDRFFVNNDEGDLMIVQLKPEGYVELDRTRLIEPTGVGGHTRTNWTRTVNWSHPAYANQHIFQRNDQELIRVSLAASDY
jgi:outer membrane protein assembly factor BamB